MAAGPRERATVDLRGLGPAVKAHARARHLTVSNVLRLAVADLLKASGSETGDVDVASTVDGARRVKLTLRLGQDAAARLGTLACASGLSQGAYVTTLIDELPAPPLALRNALAASTEQLAVVSADLNELIRTVGRNPAPSAVLLNEWLQPLLQEVRQHVGVASRLVAELRPNRRVSAYASATQGEGQGEHP